MSGPTVSSRSSRTPKINDRRPKIIDHSLWEEWIDPCEGVMINRADRKKADRAAAAGPDRRAGPWGGPAARAAGAPDAGPRGAAPRSGARTA